MKYELTTNTKNHFGITLYQIRALKDFDDVKAGDLGGWIASEENLSQEGNCWISGNAMVYGNARVFDDAIVSGTAWVFGTARVSGTAWVFGTARVSGTAWVFGTACVFGDAIVSGTARVFGSAIVYGSAMVYDDAMVSGTARVFGTARVYGNAMVSGNAEVKRGVYESTPTSITRSDGYTFTLQSDGSVVAGCRDFSPEQADAHWGDANHHMHRESWAIVMALRAIAEART